MTKKQILQYIGFDGNQLVSSTVTQRQIDQLKALQCALLTDRGEPATWTDFDNPDEPRTVFQFILNERRQRIDAQTTMENEPPIGVATIADGVCIRFEFYEGYRTLQKTHDLRSKELQSVELKDFMEANEWNAVEAA